MGIIELYTICKMDLVNIDLKMYKSGKMIIEICTI